VDGTSWFVARVHPLIDPWWELAFRAFESSVYRPAADRPALRAGTFRWVGSPASAGTVLPAAQERIHRFEQFIC
jgi:hypothetical protein